MANTGDDVVVAATGELLPGAFAHEMMENEPGEEDCRISAPGRGRLGWGVTQHARIAG